MENIKGLLLIDKPKNLSSYDCIRYIKRIIKNRIKIGHAGTLDNFATGLLIIALDRSFTKKLSNLIGLDKSYIVEAELGYLTNTLDNTGKVIKKETIIINKNDFFKRVKDFVGKYQQQPPIYSALKYNGISLYKLARNKLIDEKSLRKITENKIRTATINSINIIKFEYPKFTLEVNVSKGTYIRSLINDIAIKLNSYATATELRRTSIGKFKIDDAIKLYDIKNLTDIKNNLIEN